MNKPLFDGKHCIYCTKDTFYNLKSLNCYTPALISNLASLNKSQNYVEFGSHTILRLIEEGKASIMPTRACPEEKPFFDGSACVGCGKDEYINLKTLKCIKERESTNVAALEKSKNVVENGKYSLANLKAYIATSKIPTITCAEATPLFNGTACIACPEPEYYNI